MYIPLPFPVCSQCKKKKNESYHTKCGGLLEIDPDNNNVHCKKCEKDWDIWDSTYHCSCGHTFKASEVKKSVEDVIELCHMCAEELDLLQSAYWKRKQLACDSRKKYIENFFNKLGYASGVLFEKLVDFALEVFEKIMLK